MRASTITALQARQRDNEPFLRQHLGIEYSGLKALIGLVVHALWAIGKPRGHARLSTKPHADIVGAAQASIVAIFTLRGVGQPIAMPAEEVSPGSVELHHPPPAGDPIDNTRTDKIRPATAESARPPDDRSLLFDVLPFSIALPNSIRQDQTIPP